MPKQSGSVHRIGLARLRSTPWARRAWSPFGLAAFVLVLFGSIRPAHAQLPVRVNIPGNAFSPVGLEGKFEDVPRWSFVSRQGAKHVGSVRRARDRDLATAIATAVYDDDDDVRWNTSPYATCR